MNRALLGIILLVLLFGVGWRKYQLQAEEVSLVELEATVQDELVASGFEKESRAQLVRLWYCQNSSSWAFDQERCPRGVRMGPWMADKIHIRYPGAEVLWYSTTYEGEAISPHRYVLIRQAR